MRIFENLITPEQNEDPVLFDNTLTVENIADGITVFSENIPYQKDIVIVQNGTDVLRGSLGRLNADGTNALERLLILDEKFNILEFENFDGFFTFIDARTNNHITEIQIGRWHILSGGEVSSTGKRTTAKTFQTASGVVFQDISGYEYEEFNVQIPFLELDVYNEFKNIDLSVPHFVQWQGEFGRTDVVFCTISELTVQSIGLNAGYTMQLNLREAK